MHRCYDVADAFDAAARNLGRVRSDLRLDETARAFLWLVEHDEEGSSERIREALDTGDRWRMVGSWGPDLLLREPGGSELTLVRGRQIRTAEDLEVLVVGRTSRIPSGMSLDESVDAGLGDDTLVMIPWGFGKWTGKRGRLVMRAYERYRDDGLLLADTGARAGYRGSLEPFHAAERDGSPILAGSDPFPFPDQVGSIGRTGFVVDDLADDAWPGLLRAIRSLEGQPRRFGSPRGILDFLSLQGRMQLRKRLRGHGDR
jgi:hypothetical protein